MHGRSRMTIDPRIPTMLGRSTSGFHQPGRRGGDGGVARYVVRAIAVSLLWPWVD